MIVNKTVIATAVGSLFYYGNQRPLPYADAWGIVRIVQAMDKFLYA